MSSHIFVTVALVLLQSSYKTLGWKGGTKWASPEMEALDERNDAELLKAVQESVAAWERRRQHQSHRQKRAEAGVCYEGIGCFRDSGPYGYIDMLPNSPQEVNTRFLMYSARKNRRGDTPLLDVGFANLTEVYHWAGKAFNVSAPTKVIVHGFGSSCSHVWVYEMRSALMSVEDCNVICVDWENGATFPNYVRAAANARLVGKQVAMLIAGLNSELGLQLNDVHVIGFSLGAHVAGFAGAELKNLSRITGLDPAGPLFESQDPRARLDSSDAAFVDVIHSNGENLILGGLGSWQPMGHVDYYPNGGRMQKGCSNLFVGAVTDILWSVSEAEGRSLCNHRRAYKFFTDSVSPRCQFPAMSCESFDKFISGNCFPCPEGGNCGNMGYYSDKAKGRGTLYLVTREEEPFCAHQYLVKVESTPSVLPVVSYGKIQITLIGNADLNETFTLTQKDDEQLVVGGSLSRIIVPHPAVQEPVAVQILYSAYSGWISSGLAKWSIDKVKLVDSFGSSLSVCKRGLLLESGQAVVLPLYSGDCKHLPEQHNQANIWTVNNITSNGSSENSTIPKYIPTQVVHIGDEAIYPKENSSAALIPTTNNNNNEDSYLNNNYYWKPVPEYPDKSGNSGNGLETSSFNLEDVGGRGFINVRHISDKIWNNNTNIINNIKNFTNYNNNNNNHEFYIIYKNGTFILNNEALNETELIKRLKLNVNFNFNNNNHNDQLISTDSSNNYNNSFENITSKPGINEPIISSTIRHEIKEPVLASTTPKNSNDKLLDRTPKSDLAPPPVTATESWLHWDESTSTAALTNENGNKKLKKLNIEQQNVNETSSSLHERPFVVQLFPQRLVSLLEQAEKYARLAFSPFVTTTTPDSSSSSTSSSSTNTESRVQRMLKYFPSFWSTNESTSQSTVSKRTHRQVPNQSFNSDSTKKSESESDDIPLLYKDFNKPTRFQPRFIPLNYNHNGDKKSDDTIVARKEFNLPPVLADHIESPMSNSDYDLKYERRKRRRRQIGSR